MRFLDTCTETSHAFVLPVFCRWLAKRLTGEPRSGHNGLPDRDRARRVQIEIDELCFDLYEIAGADRRAITRVCRCQHRF